MTLPPDMLPVLGTLVAVASASDVALHRIPNALALGIAATGLLAQGLAGAGLAGIGGSALAVVLVGAAVWPAWSRGWVGGGDLKLAAAAAAWLGIGAIPAYLLTSAVAVGALAVAAYALSARSARAEVRRNLAIAAHGVPVAATLQAEGGRVQVPAGVGFAIGALATLARAGGL